MSNNEELRIHLEKSDIDVVISTFAQLVDSAYDAASVDAVNKCFEVSEFIKQREDLNGKFLALFYFIYANNWYSLKILNNRYAQVENWEQPESFKIILNLRKSISVEGFEELIDEYKSRIYTNLANELSYLGRSFEALEFWEISRKITNDHGMSIGNTGVGKQKIGEMSYDKGWKDVFYRAAYNDLAEALKHSAGIDNQALKIFKNMQKHIADILEKPEVEELSLPDFCYKLKTKESFFQRVFKLKRSCNNQNEEILSEKEFRYRKWCSHNNFFLHPLCDLGLDLGGRDFLQLPSMISSIKEIYPHFYGLFNQIKQEFVTARHMLYEGTVEKFYNEMDGKWDGLHYADKDVMLYNTLDYPAFSINVEKLKFSFRSLYSLFDKIAFFLNEYYELGLPRNKVYFQNVFSKINKLVERDFERYGYIKQNVPLRGLYWLSRDILEDDKDFKDSLEPDIQEIVSIRNHLEHKFLSLHVYDIASNDRKNKYSKVMSKIDFENKTLKLMKIVRSAIMYLPYAVFQEEQRKCSQLEREGKTLYGMELTAIDDDWKGLD